MDRADSKIPVALFALAGVGAVALAGVGAVLLSSFFQWLLTFEDTFVTLFVAAVGIWSAWVLTALMLKRSTRDEATG